MDVPHETGVWRLSYPGRDRRPTKDRIVSIERAHPYGDRVFSADHPRGAAHGFSARKFRARPIASLRGEGLIAAGLAQSDARRALRLCHDAGVPRHSGFETLRHLPDIEKLEDAGLLGRTSEALLDGDALGSQLRGVLGLRGDEDQPEEDAA